MITLLQIIKRKKSRWPDWIVYPPERELQMLKNL